MEKILLDTDLGSDIDDSFAIAYLLAQKECDLLGITTVSGEAVKRAEMASAICVNAGRPDVPIYPGADLPLVCPIVQAEAKQYPKIAGFEHRSDFVPNTAVDFMHKTVRENPGEVTLLAIGPFTNVALLFAIDPEIPSLLKRLVIMGGCFNQKDPQNPLIEWNVRCDPHAARIMFDRTPQDFWAIGADVTRGVFIPKELHTPYLDIPFLKPVFKFAEEWFTRSDRVSYHDPLAAAMIFEPKLFEFTRVNAEVIVDTPELCGANRVENAPDGKIKAVTKVDTAAFFEHFFGIFG